MVPTNAQRLFKALHRRYRSERVPIKAVVQKIIETAREHDDHLGPHHKQHIEEAIAAAERQGYIQVNWEKRRIYVEHNTQKMLNGIKHQLHDISDETEHYYAFMALVPSTFGRARDKTKAQLRRDLQVLKREHKKCPRYADAGFGEASKETQDHSRLCSPAYSMDSVQDLDVQQPPLINTASSGLEDPSLFPDSIPRRISFSIAPRYTTPPEITYDGGMVQDNVEIGRTNGIDSRGVVGPALPPHSPTGNLFSRLRQAWGGSIGASHIDEDGVADEFEKHLTAMMNCYGMTRSKNASLRKVNEEMHLVIADLQKENKKYQNDTRAANECQKTLMQEKEALQNMVRALLPGRRWLDEYQLKVQNARELVPGSESAVCVIQ